MRVGELRAILADLPDDHLVILARDAEGNSYSPLADLEPCEYTPDTTWSGDVRTPQADEDAEYNESIKINAVILCPTN